MSNQLEAKTQANKTMKGLLSPPEPELFWMRRGRTLMRVFSYQVFLLQMVVYKQIKKISYRQNRWFYAPLIHEAENRGEYKRVSELYQEWESQKYDLYIFESRELVRKAHKYHLSPQNLGIKEPWEYIGSWRYLTIEAELELKSRIEVAKNARSSVRWDKFLKLGTFLAAALAAIASVVGALHTFHK